MNDAYPPDVRAACVEQGTRKGVDDLRTGPLLSVRARSGAAGERRDLPRL